MHIFRKNIFFSFKNIKKCIRSIGHLLDIGRYNGFVPVRAHRGSCRRKGESQMKTDIMIVSNSGARMEEALNQVSKVAAYKGLSAKNALHLRLLAEEMLGMMRSIAGEADGEFWI